SAPRCHQLEHDRRLLSPIDPAWAQWKDLYAHGIGHRTRLPECVSGLRRLSRLLHGTGRDVPRAAPTLHRLRGPDCHVPQRLPLMTVGDYRAAVSATPAP